MASLLLNFDLLSPLSRIALLSQLDARLLQPLVGSSKPRAFSLFVAATWIVGYKILCQTRAPNGFRKYVMNAGGQRDLFDRFRANVMAIACARQTQAPRNATDGDDGHGAVPKSMEMSCKTIHPGTSCFRNAVNNALAFHRDKAFAHGLFFTFSFFRCLWKNRSKATNQQLQAIIFSEVPTTLRTCVFLTIMPFSFWVQLCGCEKLRGKPSSPLLQVTCVAGCGACGIICENPERWRALACFMVAACL